MSSGSTHSNSRLMKKLAAIGPYLRETKSYQDYYFFDCLAVCCNVKPTPEKREFWGWWLELKGVEEGFIYNYQFGLFDKHGEWQSAGIKSVQVQKDVEQTLHAFFPHLHSTLQEFQLTLKPCPKFSGPPLSPST